MILCLLTALAAPFGTVELITVPTPAGAWVKVEETGDAVRIRGDEEEPLTLGMALETGDVIETSQARVEVSLPDRELISISEGSDLTLQDRGLLQELGDVYYSLRGAFSVQYGTVEATVEGTRFLVETGAETLSVAKGTVRVDGTSVQTRETLPSSASAATTWRRFEMGRRLQQTWARGRPRFVVLGLFGLGVGGTGNTESFFGNDPARPFELVRVSARASPVHRLWVNGSVAFAMTGVRFRRFPFSVGADFEIFPVALGAEVMLRMYHDGSLTPGVNATGRWSIPLDRAFYLETQGRLGWVGTVYVEVSAGVGVGF